MFREGTSGHLIQALSHCDVIINLAGAPIGKRWTPEYKKELYDSRIKVTHCIIRAMDAVKTKPRLMISASAVGYYPEEGTFDEYTNTGKWLSGGTLLCMGERGPPLSVADKAGNHPLRYCALTRWRGDGTNASSLRITRVAGGSVRVHSLSLDCYSGSLSAMEFIISHEEASGVFNLVAPQQVSQYAFTQAMAARYHAWMKVVVPRWFFRMRYGEAASFLASGQNVRPTRLLEAGFRFVKPTMKISSKVRIMQL